MKPRIAKTGAVFWACTGADMRGVARSPSEAYKVWLSSMVDRARWRVEHANRKIPYGIVGTP